MDSLLVWSIVGLAHIYSFSKDQLAVELQIDAPGSYSLTLHDGAGNKLSDVLPPSPLSEGRVNQPISFQREQGKLYYMKLIKEGTVVDVKEW